MKYFIKIFTGCAICFLGVLAGIQFAKGNVYLGIFDLCLAAMDLPYLIKEVDYE